MTNQKFKKELNSLGAKAKEAKEFLLNSSVDTRNDALKFACEEIHKNRSDLFNENEKDLEEAKKLDLQNSFIDRLELNEKRVDSMIDGLNKVINLNDPIGELEEMNPSPSGFKVSKMRVPLGTIGIIYESRPNVTIDAGALCIKSGNTCILRGGSDSFHTSTLLTKFLQQGLKIAGLPETCVQIIDTTDRKMVTEILKASKYIDIIVPRGGKSLVAKIQKEAKVPVFAHLEGICHVYVDNEINLDKSIKIIINSKMRRTGICGAAETLLIDKNLEKESILKIISKLQEVNCEIRGHKSLKDIVPDITLANEEDWSTEYLDAIISVKLVDGVEQAVSHINKYSSQHTETIITENEETANYFLTNVDSAIVMKNASTQFADGGEFGMGAEIGISTGRLHARGPVGANQLTSFKYIVNGDGQIRPN